MSKKPSFNINLEDYTDLVRVIFGRKHSPKEKTDIFNWVEENHKDWIDKINATLKVYTKEAKLEPKNWASDGSIFDIETLAIPQKPSYSSDLKLISQLMGDATAQSFKNLLTLRNKTILSENTLFKSDEERLELLKDKKAVADIVAINFFGFMFLLKAIGRNPKVDEYLKANPTNARVMNIPTDATDSLQAIRLGFEAHLFNAQAAKMFTNYLDAVKQRRIDPKEITTEQIKEMLKASHLTDISRPETAVINTNLQDYISGKKTEAEIAKIFLKLSKGQLNHLAPEMSDALGSLSSKLTLAASAEKIEAKEEPQERTLEANKFNDVTSLIYYLIQEKDSAKFNDALKVSLDKFKIHDILSGLQQQLSFYRGNGYRNNINEELFFSGIFDFKDSILYKNLIKTNVKELKDIALKNEKDYENIIREILNDKYAFTTEINFNRLEVVKKSSKYKTVVFNILVNKLFDPYNAMRNDNGFIASVKNIQKAANMFGMENELEALTGLRNDTWKLTAKINAKEAFDQVAIGLNSFVLALVKFGDMNQLTKWFTSKGGNAYLRDPKHLFISIPNTKYENKKLFKSFLQATGNVGFTQFNAQYDSTDYIDANLDTSTPNIVQLVDFHFSDYNKQMFNFYEKIKSEVQKSSLLDNLKDTIDKKAGGSTKKRAM